MNHRQLLLDFERLGIPSRFGTWYQSFLTGGSYCVQFRNSRSSHVRFANSVPQGSVSDPLPFVIYTVALITRLQELEKVALNTATFADDLTIWHSSKSAATSTLSLQRGLNIVETWSGEYEMPLSDRKTEAICFSRARHCANASTSDDCLFLKGKAISFSSQVRLLGVMLDSKHTS